MRRGAAAALTIGVLAGGGGGVAHATAPPPLLAVLDSRLVALEPRTLRPLATPRPLSLPGGLLPGSAAVLSPDGRRVAVPTRTGLLVVDRLRLRLLRRITSEAYTKLLGEPIDVAWSTGGSFVVAGEGKFGLALSFIGSDQADTDIEGEWLRTSDGLAVLAPATTGALVLIPYTPEEAPGIAVDLAPGRLATAVDTHRRRIYMLALDGTIAVVDLATWTASYGSVDAVDPLATPTSLFSATWAGAGRLAVVGGAGLSFLDVRDWTLRLVDATATAVRAAPRALVAWGNEASGIAVYGADGSLRFRALAGARVRSVGVTARYAYVDTETRRYAVELRSGRVTGPLSSRALLVLPPALELP